MADTLSGVPPPDPRIQEEEARGTRDHEQQQIQQQPEHQQRERQQPQPQPPSDDDLTWLSEEERPSVATLARAPPSSTLQLTGAQSQGKKRGRGVDISSLLEKRREERADRETKRARIRWEAQERIAQGEIDSRERVEMARLQYKREKDQSDKDFQKRIIELLKK